MVMRASFRLLSTACVILLLAVAMPAPIDELRAAPASVEAQQQTPPAQPQPAQPPAGQPPANPQQPAEQRPVFRGGINFVSVDVIVTDKKSGDVNGQGIVHFGGTWWVVSAAGAKITSKP